MARRRPQGAKVRKSWEASSPPRRKRPSSTAPWPDELPANAFAALDAHIAKAEAESPPPPPPALRRALAELVPTIPEMVGGSADLHRLQNTIVRVWGRSTCRTTPAATSLWRARVRHGGGDERHGAARG